MDGLDTAPGQSAEFAARSAKVFPYAAGCLPSNLPLMKDARFVKDRGEFSGQVRKIQFCRSECTANDKAQSYKKEDVDAARPRVRILPSLLHVNRKTNGPTKPGSCWCPESVRIHGEASSSRRPAMGPRH